MDSPCFLHSIKNFCIIKAGCSWSFVFIHMSEFTKFEVMRKYYANYLIYITKYTIITKILLL